MSYANFKRAATHVFVGSIEELGRRLEPSAGVDYCVACDVPSLLPPPGFHNKVAEAITALDEQRYLDATERTLEAVEMIRVLLSAETEPELLELYVQRLLLPVTLDVLRKGEEYTRAKDPLGEPAWYFKIGYIVGIILLSLDDRLSEWFSETFSGNRLATFLGLGIKTWADASDGGDAADAWPFYLLDVLAAANAVLINVVEGEGGTHLWNGHGWDAPESGVGGNALAAAQRTYAVWIERHPNFAPEAANYEKSAPTVFPDALGLALTPLSRDQGGPSIAPFISGDWAEAIKIGKDWRIALGADFGLEPTAPGGGQTTDMNLSYVGKDPVIAFGDSGKDAEGTGIELGKIKVDARLRLAAEDSVAQDESEARIVLRLLKGKFKIKKPDNAFLRRIVPEGIEGKFSAAFGASTRDGFYWEGGLGTDVFTAIDWRSPGPVALEVRHLRFGTKFKKAADEGAKLDLEAGLGLTAHVGPVSFGVNDLGAKLTLAQAKDNDGDIGPLDFKWDVLTPTSIQFAIDYSIGAGFIARDVDLDRWAGAWTVKLGRVKFDGIVIAEQGSLLAIAWATNLGIPLPGGTLDGAGLMLGLDRRGDADMFLDGLKTGALGAVLFPADPVSEAPQLIATLTRLFPIAEDSVVAGLMMQWRFGGASRLIVAELGVIFEFGGSELKKIYVLGQGDMTLPSVPESIYRLHFELFGEFDFDTGNFFMRGELRDSRIVGGELTGGGLIARDDKADDPWIISFGGFSPRYAAPPRFGRIRRIAAHLADRENLKIYFELYLAATSSTLQAGGKLALYAGIKGFVLEGALALDVLYKHDGEFALDFAFLVSVKRGSRTLFSVDISGTLTGTSTWRMIGKATIKIVFVKISLPFEWVSEGGDAAQIEAVDGLAALKAAFEAPDAWLAEETDRSMVTLIDRQRDGVWAAPDRGLRVSQRIAPLGETLVRLGAAPIAGGPDAFDLGPVHLAGQTRTVAPVTETFNLALYRDVNLEEAVRAPFKETMRSGFSIGADDVVAGDDVAAIAVHEPLFLDSAYQPYTSPPEDPPAEKEVSTTETTAGNEAFIAKAPPSEPEVPPDAPPPPAPEAPDAGDFYQTAAQLFAITPPRFSVVDTALNPQSGGADLGFASARDQVVDARARQRQRFVVRRHEVAA